MRPLIGLMMLLTTATAFANEAKPTVIDQVDQHEVRAVGKLNVNLATRQELLSTGLDAGMIDQLLRRRERAPIADLAGLPVEARRRLKTDGASDYYRIRKLPLERYDLVTTASR